MSQHRKFSTRLVLMLMLAGTPACGGGEQGTAKAAAGRCGPLSDDAVGIAVTEYVKQASPTPQRFLFAAATDSTLPDAAVAALQNKGPTFFYPPDSAQQVKVREQLAAVGGYATLLVVRRPAPAPSDTLAVVRLGGHYVGGEIDGAVATSRQLGFRCDVRSRQWRFVRSEEEKQS